MDAAGKYAAAGAIWVVGVACGFAPSLVVGSTNPGIPKTSLLVLMDGFAAGVFLGGGLIHLLNDAIERLNDFDYPVVSVRVGVEWPLVGGEHSWSLLESVQRRHRNRGCIT